jgi:hypothetical protein
MGHLMNYTASELIDINRAIYAALCKAEEAFDASDEYSSEDGDLEIAMNRALHLHKKVYADLLKARPRTNDEMAAMIVYVNEVAKQQDDKGALDDGPTILMANLNKVVRLAA